MGDLNIRWEAKLRLDLSHLIEVSTRISNTNSTQIDLAFTNRAQKKLKSYNMLNWAVPLM